MHSPRSFASCPIILAALIGLAGCSSSEGPDATANKADAPSEIATLPGVDGGPPRLREGLWTMTSDVSGKPSESRMCVDAAMQEKMNILGGQMAPDCTENSVKPRLGGGYEMRSVCNMGAGGQTEASGVVTGDLRTGYRSEMTVTTTGSSVAQMNGTQKMISTATHSGPCPADMKPGDMEVAGMKINVLEMSEQAAAMQAAP